jgi:hypothetical protein
VRRTVRYDSEVGIDDEVATVMSIINTLYIINFTKVTVVYLVITKEQWIFVY